MAPTEVLPTATALSRTGDFCPWGEAWCISSIPAVRSRTSCAGFRRTAGPPVGSAAGQRDVFVMGGGALIGSCLRDGLLDELRLHLSPEVLGAGTPLFAGVGRHRLHQTAVEVSPVCTHLTYRIDKARSVTPKARHHSFETERLSLLGSSLTCRGSRV